MLTKLFSRIKSMAKVTINGVTYQGSNISVQGSTVKIDGKVIGSSFTSPLEVRVLEGVIGEITADGSVNCGDVAGSVEAGGSVNCDDVGGDVSAGGSVNCDSVAGSIKAGGSVIRL